MRSRFVVLCTALQALGCSSSNPSICPEALCDGVCCADGGQCIANACCPAAQVCDTSCCTSGSTCVAGTTGGARFCGKLCQKSGDCPAATPCCSLVTGSAEGFCSNASSSCLCITSTECDAGQCAPMTNASGHIAGPYVCVANDGNSFDGCAGTSCQLGTQSCAQDLIGNQFCSISCSSDLNCGNTGVACCSATCSGSGGHCCGLCGH